MKMTPGKLAGMKAVANDRGVIAAAAMDQRGSLQKSLAKEKGGDVEHAERSLPIAEMIERAIAGAVLEEFRFPDIK